MSSLFLAATGALDGISPPIAVLAGLVSFVSPCVLPLVPAYLAYLGARAGEPVALAGGPGAAVVAQRPSTSLPVAAAGLSFVAGLSLVFILFFYVFSLVVQPVRAYVPVVAGIFVIVMALQVAGLIRIPFLMGEYRAMKEAPRGGGVAGGFVLGMGFASGWTPCIGITLSAVLSSAVTAGTTAQGLGLMVAYCLGLGLPFVLIALLWASLPSLPARAARLAGPMTRIGGVLTAALGLLLLSGWYTHLTSFLAQISTPS